MLSNSDIYNAIQETPRKAAIAGVEFVRTKRGNLIRAPGKGDRTRYTWQLIDSNVPLLNLFHRFNNAAPKRQCEMFTRQGNPTSSKILYPGLPLDTPDWSPVSLLLCY